MAYTTPRPIPTVSVCMPMYNAERYLQESIDSVLTQKFTDFEFLIVDDGSTDQSCSIVRSYKDPRIRLIENKHDYIGSLNLLLSEAKGKYIARMDADDVMMQDRLQIQFDYMESHQDTDVHVGALCLYSDAHNTLVSPVLDRPCQLRDILGNNIFANPSTMLRLSSIKKYGVSYEQDYIYAEDYRFWARLIHAGARIICTNKIFMRYRRSAGQVSIRHSDKMWAVTRRIQEDITDWITATAIEKYTPPVIRKSDRQLTVIIPFLNEGEEVVETVKSIRSTVGNDVDIFVINDQSTDEYPYDEELQTYKVYYFFNRKRMGVAASRDFGVAQCLTPYFILLDAHMRFYDNKWASSIIAILKENDRQLLCCQTKVLKKDTDGHIYEENIDNRPTTYGAYMPFSKNDYLLNVVWNNNCRQPEATTEPIAIVLGAGYATSKRYWTYLKGLNGLSCYGSDEAYISLKVWLEGGQCLLLKDIEAGHIYRDAAPYPVYGEHVAYNQLFIADTVLPPDMRYWTYAVACSLNKHLFFKSYRLIMEHQTEIAELQEYYDRIFTRHFKEILPLHRFCEKQKVQELLKRKELLPEVLDWLIKQDIHESSLFNGRAAVTLWLLHYEKYSGIDLSEYWIELLEEIREDIEQQRLPWNFKNGLCGIGWMYIYLSTQGYILENIEPILQDIDREIVQLSATYIEDDCLETGIGGLLCYIVTRMRYSSSKSKPLTYPGHYLTTLQKRALQTIQNSHDAKVCYYAFQFIDILKSKTALLPDWAPKISDWIAFPKQIPNESKFWKIGDCIGYTLLPMILDEYKKD